MRNKQIIILLALLTFNTFQVAGSVDVKGVKAVLIYQLSNHIIWPDSKVSKQINIGFYGRNQETYEEFLGLRNLRIQDKPVVARKLKSLSNLGDLHVLVLDKNSSIDLFAETILVENKHILLISEESMDLKNIMLNIFFDEEKKNFSYQINKSNILLEGLDIDPELLLLRGTELDVRQLYRAMKEELENEKKAVEYQRRLLAKSKREIEDHKSEILNLNAYSKRLNTDIGNKGVELDALSDEIKFKEEQIVEQQRHFDQRLQLFSELEKQMANQQSLIKVKTDILDSLERASSKQQEMIKEQSLILNDKEVRIQLQRRAIYLTAGLVLVILISLIIAYRAYISKGAIADKLKSANERLEIQHADNLKLNEDLRRLNEMLEIKVAERTKGLKEKNEQLTEYAFVNSHLLRAPLSRILGISQLLQANSSKEDLDLINAMKNSADELDAIIRRINVLLDEEGSFDRSRIEELIKKRIYDTEVQKGPVS